MWEKVQAMPLASLCPSNGKGWSCCGDKASHSPDKSLHLPTLLSSFRPASRKKRHFLSWSLVFASKMQEEDLVKEEEKSPKSPATAEFYSHPQPLPPQKVVNRVHIDKSNLLSSPQERKKNMPQPHVPLLFLLWASCPVFGTKLGGPKHWITFAFQHVCIWVCGGKDKICFLGPNCILQAIKYS